MNSRFIQFTYIGCIFLIFALIGNSCDKLSGGTPVFFNNGDGGFTLTTAVNPAGTGEVNPGPGTFEEGQQINITAIPNEGFYFVNWTGNTSFIANANLANTTITMPAADISITANFQQVPEVGDGEVFSPATGRVWMDRNLGAGRVATSTSDAQAFGDLYQWGRAADGHQELTSATTTTHSNSDQPAHNNFIIGIPENDYAWRVPQNDNLWQGVNGVNNPCPDGFRLPTDEEWTAELQSWSSKNREGAFESPLKLPSTGFRRSDNGTYYYPAVTYYWSSTIDGVQARPLSISTGNAGTDMLPRASGFSVRCIKD